MNEEIKENSYNKKYLERKKILQHINSAKFYKKRNNLIKNNIENQTLFSSNDLFVKNNDFTFSSNFEDSHSKNFIKKNKTVLYDDKSSLLKNNKNIFSIISRNNNDKKNKTQINIYDSVNLDSNIINSYSLIISEKIPKKIENNDFINIGTKKIPIYKKFNDRCNQSCKDFFINKKKDKLNESKINVDKNNRYDSNIFIEKLENKSNNTFNLKKLKKRILFSNKSIMTSSTKIRDKKNSYNNSSVEIKKQKSSNLQNFNNKNSMREIFYCKPLIIKCVKQTPSLSNNNQMRKKNLFPFKNSFGVVLDDANKKTYFLKGSIDFIYPRITVKKFYEDKKNHELNKFMREQREKKKRKLEAEKYYILKNYKKIKKNRALITTAHIRMAKTGENFFKNIFEKINRRNSLPIDDTISYI